ncbi:MAG TPA: hypothetical protein VG755_44070 [Nannocystaceae bacterium]|nr:hypothetical protein [Nannocystaceae bacterium]
MSLLALACDPKSQSLSEEGGDASGSGSEEESSAGSSDTGVEPPPGGEVRWDELRPDVSGSYLAIGSDGSVHVAGNAGFMWFGDGGTFERSWLGKLAADGTELWVLDEPVDGEEGSVWPLGLDVAADDTVYVGWREVSLAGDVMRISAHEADGALRWTSTDLEYAESVGAFEGGVIVGGGRETSSNHGVAWARAFDDDGVVRWTKEWGDPTMKWSDVRAIAATANGGAILGGHAGTSLASSAGRAWAVAVDADGNTLWEALLSDGVVTDSVNDVAIASNGDVLVIGVAETPFVKALAADTGAELWTFTPAEVTGSQTIAATADGGFVITDGLTLPPEDPNACETGSGPCPSNMRVARYEADRSVRWLDVRDDCGAGIAVASAPNDDAVAIGACGNAGSTVQLGIFDYAP